MEPQHVDAISDDKEVELKLGLSRRAAATLCRHPLVKAAAVAGPEQRRLATVYYDTPDLDLFHDGHFLRVRDDGNSTVQALKSRASVVAGLEIRRESEYPLDDHRPKPELIVDPPPCLRDPEVLAALRPTVTTAFTRTSWMIATEGGGRIELAFDRGHILAGDRRLPLCEIELELKHGPAAVIFDFALALADAVPLRIGEDSKAVRGFSAIAAGAPGWSKARKLVHAGGDSTEAVLVRIVGACLEQISLNQACAAAGSDPEGVHQLRVGIRRLRSALSVYANLVADDEASTVRAELRWLATRMGPARDIDVFVTDIIGPIADAFDADPGVAALRTLADQRRATAYRGVRRALRSRRALCAMLTAGRWLENRAWRAVASTAVLARLDHPVEGFAARVLAKRHRRLHKIGASLEHRSTDDLHRLRIEIKKQRYAVEYFAGVFAPRRAQKYLLALKTLQDGLGLLNDAAVAQRILDDLLRDVPRSGARRRDAERGAALVTGWHGAKIAAQREDLDEYWRHWRRCKPFWE